MGRLCFNQPRAAVALPQLGFFDLARRVPGNGRKDDLPRALVARQLQAELVDLVLRAGGALLQFDNRRCDLALPLIRQANDGDILDLIVSP